MQVSYTQRTGSRQGVRLTFVARILRGNVVPLPGLRRLRILAALSQGELAEKAGLQRQTISRLENGGEAGMPTVRALATTLGVEPRDLIEPKPID